MTKPVLFLEEIRCSLVILNAVISTIQVPIESPVSERMAGITEMTSLSSTKTTTLILKAEYHSGKV